MFLLNTYPGVNTSARRAASAHKPYQPHSAALAHPDHFGLRQDMPARLIRHLLEFHPGGRPKASTSSASTRKR